MNLLSCTGESMDNEELIVILRAFPVIDGYSPEERICSRQNEF